MVEWCYLGPNRFKFLSFAQTVEEWARTPFNLLFSQQTPIAVLGESYDARPGLSPSGFVFQSSRSGAALISQMLASRPGTIVLTSVRSIDLILRAHFRSQTATEAERINWLRWMVSALAQPRTGTKKQLFIAFEAWHIFALPLIRRAFPNVPWLFVYGDPSEVLTSQLSHREAHMVPGAIEPDLLGFDDVALQEMESEEHCAKVLAAICKAALQHHTSDGLLVNDNQLPYLAWPAISEFFGINYSAAEIEIMKSKTKPPCDDRAVILQLDSTQKRRRATEKVIEAADRWAARAYQHLEAARLEAPTRNEII
jgi:hypothetical protein